MRARWLGVAAALALALTGCSAVTSGTGRTVAHAASPRAAVVATPAPARQATPVRPAAAATTTRSAPSPCAHNDHAQLVLVHLAVQHLWLCRHHRVDYSTPITSGMRGQWTETPTGSYAIQGVQRDTTLTLISGATYAVKYWIPFDGPLFGFHDSSWQDFPYGSNAYRTRGSHGCIHMPLKAIAFLAGWAHVGTRVSIS